MAIEEMENNNDTFTEFNSMLAKFVFKQDSISYWILRRNIYLLFFFQQNNSKNNERAFSAFNRIENPCLTFNIKMVMMFADFLSLLFCTIKQLKTSYRSVCSKWKNFAVALVTINFIEQKKILPPAKDTKHGKLRCTFYNIDCF